MNLKVKILSWLIHHANRAGRNEYFYKIKNRVLSKHGKHICYDVQFIEGKECFSCGGTGQYRSWEYGLVTCWNCFGGWYKRPVWNILERVQFGKYTFHQPFQRAYNRPDISTNIVGYIEHGHSKHSSFALFVLFLMYEKGYLKRYWKSTGNGWRVNWWYRKAIIPNIIHIIKKGKRSHPALTIKRKLRWLRVWLNPSLMENELPF